ncbi:MAG: biotin transporter BioY [Dehalococcoidia bacterium]|nr:biotin transporter BioY [Dehalococcoidia bacterium]
MSARESQVLSAAAQRQSQLVRLFRELVALMVGTVFLAVLAQVSIPLPFTPVPITGQTLGVLLIGALYGPWRGALCLLAYLGEGASGLPVFAGGTSGTAPFVGPTGGYLVAFPVAAAIVGLLVRPLHGVLSGWLALPGLLVGTGVIYFIGVPGLAMSTGMEITTAIAKGMLPFIPGDLLKVVVAAAVLPSGTTALRSLGWPMRGPTDNANGTT